MHVSKQITRLDKRIAYTSIIGAVSPGMTFIVGSCRSASGNTLTGIIWTTEVFEANIGIGSVDSTTEKCWTVEAGVRVRWVWFGVA